MGSVMGYEISLPDTVPLPVALSYGVAGRTGTNLWTWTKLPPCGLVSNTNPAEESFSARTLATKLAGQ